VSSIDQTPTIENIDVQITPNPASTNAHVQINLPDEVQSIQLYDLTGKLIFEKHRQINHVNALPITGLPPGMYFVLLQLRDGQHIHQKLAID
jgi:Secretion system C-terminal sorting domain